jgi:Protein-L-isoaspartate(D-aspartate) O-methyltransferase (PCMT)
MVTEMTFEDPQRARQLRASLVEHLVRVGDVQSPGVRDALLRVPRHLFVPPQLSLEDAYANRPAPIGHGQTISQPTIVAVMTEALELRGTERVLEIGTGSGYQAAVVSLLAPRCSRSSSFRSSRNELRSSLRTWGIRTSARGRATAPEVGLSMRPSTASSRQLLLEESRPRGCTNSATKECSSHRSRLRGDRSWCGFESGMG